VNEPLDIGCAFVIEHRLPVEPELYDIVGVDQIRGERSENGSNSRDVER